VPEALACFDRVLEIDANHVDARIGRAKVSISLQKSGEAIEDLLRVQKIQPEHPELLLLLGIAYRFEKRFDRAHELIVGYLQRNPESSHGYFEKGLNESNSKRAKEARDSFTRAIEYSKGNSQWRILSHRHRAKAWRTLGETNREKEDLNAYLRLLPEARDRGEVEARLAELAGD
jgi:tetratricopeptide (TPR) repeat protein